MVASVFRQLILGIDPGYDRCGWSLVAQQGQQLKAVEYGCVETNRRAEKYDRFAQIHQEIGSQFAQYPIDVLALESLYFSRNVSTALPVSEVRGMLFAIALNRQLPVHEYTPQEVKLAVTGYGNAPKQQVMEMIQRELKLEKIPNLDDTGDALAVALTHAMHSRQKVL